MRKPLRGIGRAMLFCMGFHWIKVKGRLSSPEEAPILAVAPHSSFIDALALAVICISSPISRKENESIPLVGGLFNLHFRSWQQLSLRHQNVFHCPRLLNASSNFVSKAGIVLTGFNLASMSGWQMK